MDIVQGDFSFDLKSGQVKSSVARSGFLDPEIANEGEYGGQKIILSDGDKVSWTPPRVKPNIPDWSEFEPIKKYFNRTGYQTWPCWFYHPTHKPVLVRDAEEAAERFGIKRRKATDRERALQGAGEYVWDTPEDCQWQPAPYKGNVPGKFNPDIGEQGKNYMPKAADPLVAQHALIEQLVKAMQGGQNDLLAKLLGGLASGVAAPAAASPAAPGGIDPAEWDEFQKFQAFKRGAAAPAAERPVDEEKAAWIAKANEAGIKVDGRWSVEKLQQHVLAELEKRVAEAEAGAASGEPVI